MNLKNTVKEHLLRLFLARKRNFARLIESQSVLSFQAVVDGPLFAVKSPFHALEIVRPVFDGETVLVRHIQ